MEVQSINYVCNVHCKFIRYLIPFLVMGFISLPTKTAFTTLLQCQTIVIFPELLWFGFCFKYAMP